VPPTRGIPVSRVPPPPPSLRPNVPATPLRSAAPLTPPHSLAEDVEEEGISVDDSELLE
jgi:hypothetical protein